MPTKEQKMLSRLEAWCAGSAYHFSLRELFTWEVRQSMPKKGNDYRQGMSAYYGRLEHQHLNSPESRDLLDWFGGHPPQDPTHQAMVRELQRTQAFRQVPADLMARKQALCATATAQWEDCCGRNDAQSWLPGIQALMDIHREIALIVNDAVHPMQVWVDQYEYDLKMEDLEQYFEEIQTTVVPLLELHQGIKPVEKRITGFWNQARLMRICQAAARAAGFEESFGVWGETRLPFSSIIGPQDVRIAVNFSAMPDALLGVLHEAGHAVYAASADQSLHENGLWRPFVGAYDEAMAIFWERMVGMNEPFLRYFFPQCQQEITEFRGVGFEPFFADVNAVSPDCIRVGADELSYPLHIIVRYQLEKQLLEGSLLAKDLPDAWNAVYLKVLGIAPPDDLHGCLQDIHWGLGLIGYFPSYTLGTMMAAQIHQVAERAGVVAPISEGNFQPLQEWMRMNCYQQGMTETPQQILTRVTGNGLRTDDYRQYLSQKYG